MPESLAEQLGFSATDRIAIVHADDIGMCHAANEGAFDALESGVATCGSIMVPCPWFREAADRAAANPALDLGVHLTLNAEWPHYRWGPVAGRDRVPSLVDDQGYLPRTTAETVQRAKPEEVEIELRAQIEAALGAGIDVTHIDSHMGTVLFPPFLETYVKLAREYRLPAFAARADRAQIEAAGLPGAAEPMLRNVFEALEAAGLPILDGFNVDSLSFSPGDGEAHNGRRLDGLEDGVSYYIIHPARNGEELEVIADESAHVRSFEHQFFSGEGGRVALESRGIKTTGMRQLRDLARRRG